MLIQNQVGPLATTASITSGLQTPQRAGNLGDTIVSELHGRYYETTYRRAMFTAGVSTVIATATTASPTTTITGAQVLYNPIGSTVNLVLNKVSMGFVLAQIANVIGIATGVNTATTISGTLTPTTAAARNKYVGGATGIGVSYASSSITLPTAVALDTILFSTGSNATTALSSTGLSAFDLEGGIVLPPGAYATVWSQAAIPASSLLTTFQWEEVPI
jgi:hypothetical protein